MATVETILSSVFNTVVELHSGQLGLLAGVVVVVLYWHGYHRSSLALLTGFYLVALGFVPATSRALVVTQSQPWYFGSMLVGTGLVGIVGRVAWVRALETGLPWRPGFGHREGRNDDGHGTREITDRR